jgi:hypothetical protein
VPFPKNGVSCTRNTYFQGFGGLRNHKKRHSNQQQNQHAFLTMIFQNFGDFVDFWGSKTVPKAFQKHSEKSVEK